MLEKVQKNLQNAGDQLEEVMEQEDESRLLPALEVGQSLDCKEIIAMDHLYNLSVAISGFCPVSSSDSWESGLQWTWHIYSFNTLIINILSF